MNKITVDVYSVNLYFSQLHFQFPCIPAVKNKLGGRGGETRKCGMRDIDLCWRVEHGSCYLGHISSSVAFGLSLMNWVSPCDRMRYFQSNTRTVKILALKKVFYAVFVF